MIAETQNEEMESLFSSARVLKEFLEKDASFEQHLKEIIDRELAQGVTVNTFGEVGQRLVEYVGEEPASSLMRLITEENVEELLEAIRAQTSLEKEYEPLLLLRRLRALYRENMWAAFSIWRENPQDWKELNRSIYYDQENEAWSLKINLQKYNGEKISLESSPSSIMSLANFLLNTLNKLPDGKAIPSERLEEFQQELQAFSEKFLTKQESAPQGK